MTEQKIPLTADAWYSIDIVLDESLCRMTFHWNETDKAWYMDFENLTEGYVLNGLKLVPGCDLLYPHATPELGILSVIDTENKNQNPDFDLMGDRYQLMYIPRADLG